MALATAREIVKQICLCGHTQGDHGALDPYAEPGLKGVGLGLCYADRELGEEPKCGCQRFRRAKLRVEVA